MTRKRARRLVHRIAHRDAIAWRIAEHLYETKILEPSNAILLANRILADIEPMIADRVRHELNNELHDPTTIPGLPGEES